MGGQGGSGYMYISTTRGGVGALSVVIDLGAETLRPGPAAMSISSLRIFFTYKFTWLVKESKIYRQSVKDFTYSRT